MSELVTNSRLVDEIKNCWCSYKDEIDYPISGDYYYNLIQSGIFENNIIKIPLDHLPTKVYQQLDELRTETVKKIFFRCVREIFQDKYGRHLTSEAARTQRIRIMLV